MEQNAVCILGNYDIRRLGDDNVTCCAGILVLNADVFIVKHVKVN